MRRPQGSHDPEDCAEPQGEAADEEASEEEAGEEEAGEDVAPARFDAWRRRSAAGAVGTAVARGLSAVFAPTENRPVVSAPVPGDPPDSDQGFRVLLDPDDPTKSIALFAAPEDEPGQDPGERGPAGTSEAPSD